jgi:hypothetical protein
MSFEEELEKAAADLAREKMGEWRKNPKWLAIEGITREDLIKGTGRIEKLDYPPWDKKASKQEDKTSDELVGFGKHAQLTVKELKEKHYNYFAWASENIPRFAAKVKLLKL